MMKLLEEQKEALIKDKDLLHEDKTALLRQLEAKDKQIDRFFASERDTKTLFGRFQGMFSGLLPKKAGEGRSRSRRVSTAALSPAGGPHVITRADGTTASEHQE